MALRYQDDLEVTPSDNRKARHSFVSFQRLNSNSLNGMDWYGDEAEYDDEMDGDEVDIQKKDVYFWQWFVENKWIRRGFNSLSLANLLVLLLSYPFFELDDENLQNLRIQFSIITGVDFILSLLYTFHLVMIIRYGFYIRFQNKQDESSNERINLTGYTSFFHIFIFTSLTLLMWLSVGLGVYRTVIFFTDENKPFWLYAIYALRSLLNIPSLLMLFQPQFESSLLKQILGILNVKQLCMVVVFYLVFISLFALCGVHVIGGLDYICVYNNSIPAVPLTHCEPNSTLSSCPHSSFTGFSCELHPDFKDNFNFNNTYNFNYRTHVYYGQFRTIVDSIFAVYEASTLELWSFMMISAINGRGLLLTAIFYLCLIFFIVILLQQSIFLVVIIESFSDIRSQSGIWGGTKVNSLKQSNKPTTVLKLQSGSQTQLRLQTKTRWNPHSFILKYGTFLNRLEKFFLFLVLIDFIMTSLKRADFSDDNKMIWKCVLQGWQVFVSIIFLLEVIFLFIFHLYHGQWRLFIKRSYYIALVILAVGGIVACIPIEDFYYPLKPANVLAIFQVFRFFRLIRISESVKSFFHKVMGNFRIPKLIGVTFFVIIILSIVNAQLFGYIPVPPQCKVTSDGLFSNIFDAILFTFQLVLNEAWTDITSEVMCGHEYWWIPMNIYFIVIHLFSSLIFFNFFGAVILDNLEYDEDIKKQKLEEITNKEIKPDTVPIHLKVFKKLKNQPKRLHPPGAGLIDPSLDEVEVRRFFDSANTPVLKHFGFNDYVTPFTTIHQPAEKNNNQLHQLSLLSVEDDEDLLPTNSTVALEGKHRNITAILEFVKLWRHQAEEENVKSGKSQSQFHNLFRNLDRNVSQNAKVRSEFDEYREKHRCFDMSLFCMSPENKFRKFCTILLTAQAQPPKQDLKSDKILELVRVRTFFCFKWIISQMSYLKWIMFIGLWSVIAVQIVDYSNMIKSSGHKYNMVTEGIYILMMFFWLLLNVFSKGLFLNPNAAISSIWDIFDWILFLNGVILYVLIPVWKTEEITSIELNICTKEVWVKALMGIRSFRLLHIISLFSGLRAVVRELLEGWRNLLKGLFIMMIFMLIFANLGVQFFAGTDVNPLAFCNDPTIATREDCFGEFEMPITQSREFIPMEENFDDVILVPRVWFSNARDYPFSNVLYAFVTLFNLLTLEGWLEVRDLFDGKKTAGTDTAHCYMVFYIHIFVFLAVNLGLQLFLGIVVNNYNEHKPDHRFLLSVDQNRWLELMQRISLQRPYKLPAEPRKNWFRLKIYQALTHKHYRSIPTFVNMLSALTLVLPWGYMYYPDWINKLLVISSLVLNSFSVIEMFAKLFAFGSSYFLSWRNIFDAVLAVVTVFYIILGVCFLSLDRWITEFSVFAFILASCKCITILLKYSSMLNLLITVGSTIVRTIPHINVLMVIFLSYSMLGVVLFSDNNKGETINYSWINFHGIEQAIISMSRTLTGEDWYQLMWDVADVAHYDIYDSARVINMIVAIVYFFSFIIIVPFILLNVFIAALLENFSIFYNDDDTKLNHSVIKDFKHKWRWFDVNAKGHVKINKIKLLLRSLDLQKYYSYMLRDPTQRNERVECQLIEDPLLLWEMEEELYRAISTSFSKTAVGNFLNDLSSDVNVAFLDVLRMLAYRCENIRIRLESHELYTREQLEKTVQFDVAEICILKWLRKCVKPVMDYERNQIQPTNEQTTFINVESSRTCRQQQLLSLHNMQSKLILQPSWGAQMSLDTEDEDGHLNRQSRSHMLSSLTHYTSDENVESVNQHDEDSAYVRSYAKLLQKTQTQEISEQKERAKEWFQMQHNWNNNIVKNESYFDDHL